MSPQEIADFHFLFLKQKMINEARKYITPLFWRGKRFLFFDIEKFSQKTSIPILDILSIIGVNKIGFNCSTQSPDDENLFIGTLIIDDTLYLSLACSDDGSSYKSDIRYIM